MVSAADDQPSSLLESLPARPPTPPRELRSHECDPVSKDITAASQLASHLQRMQTPPGVLSPATSSGTSTTRRKRVGFSARAQYQEPPLYPSNTSTSHAQSPLAPSYSASKPVKGILKQTAVPNRLGPADGLWLDIDKPGQVNVAAMLESTLQQLAGADRDSKVDAYTMLFRGLKASSNLPDRIALQEKMGLFTQFIQRDLSERPLDGTLDIVLSISALKLLHTFLGFPGIASSIPRDFGVFLISHCALSFEGSQVPKEVVRHLMQALYLQKFPSDVMTCDRVGRLLKSLHGIENRISGKSIVQGRIRLYDRLVRQYPQHMIVHVDWLQDLFQDICSSIKEVRTAATKFGLHAAFAFSKERKMAVRVLDLLHRSDDEDKEFIELIIERLSTMLRSKEDSPSVPQVWSIIHLFVPNPRKQIWSKPWSDMVGRSFNNSSAQTKKEANLAWGRLIYRTFLDKSLTQTESMRMLRDTMFQQLMRKGLQRSSLDSILNTIRTFLYYTFKPDSSHKNLDNSWDIALSPLLLQLMKIDHGNTNATNAAAILAGLIDCQTRRVWKENRICDIAVVNSNELPALDPKWIRSNSQRVFQLVNRVLANSFAELSVADSPFQQLWHALVASVASASAKDVKLHDDTAKFVADALTFLASKWTQGLGDGETCSSSLFLDSARDYLLTLIRGVGLLPNPFIDKYFVRTRDNQFIPQLASTHRASKSQGTKRLPLHHLFQLLYHLPPGIPDNNATAQFFHAVLAPFFEDKSIKAQVDLAQELLCLLPVDAYCPYGIWTLCSSKALTLLEADRTDQFKAMPKAEDISWPQYRDTVKLLERGLRSSPDLPWLYWCQLFHELTTCVGSKMGEAGVSIAIVEQLATVVNDMLDGSLGSTQLRPFDATIELVSISNHPRDKEAVDAARQHLWGTFSTSTPLTTFDPFDNMYKLVSSALEKAYMNKEVCSDACIALMNTVEQFFDRAHRDLAFCALTSVQYGFICWLKDENGSLTRPASSDVYKAFRSLWLNMCSILAATPTEKFRLNAVEPVLCAAFGSRHDEIIQTTTRAWNEVFEKSRGIEYPDALKTVLVSLGNSFDITRPGLGPFEGERKGHSGTLAHASDDIISTPIDAPGMLQDLPDVPLSTSKSDKSDKMKRPKDKQKAAPLTRSTIRTRSQKDYQEASNMRSNTAPLASSQVISQDQQHGSVEPYRAETPEQDPDFDNCIASTPTPRRGQSMPMPLHDQEMADPPSSPPESSSYHLLAELKARARDIRSFSDWQLSSSPISGSPIAAAVNNQSLQPMSLNETDEGELYFDAEATMESDTSSTHARQEAVLSSQPKTVLPFLDHRYYLNATCDPVQYSRPLYTTEKALYALLKAPLRLRHLEKHVCAAPEELVKKTVTGRVEIPLQSSQLSSPRKMEYTSFTDILPESPQQVLVQEESQDSAHNSDSIEVLDTTTEKSKCGRPRKDGTLLSTSQMSEAMADSDRSQISEVQETSTAQPKKPAVIDGLVTCELQEIFENVSPGNGQWLRKRKLSVSSVHSVGDGKRARHDEEPSTLDEQSITGRPNAGVEEDCSFEFQPTLDLRLDEAAPQLNKTTASVEIQPSGSTPSAVDESVAAPGVLFTAESESVNDQADGNQLDDIMQDYADEDGEDDDDDEAVHSQLAREEQQASSGSHSQSQPESNSVVPSKRQPESAVDPMKHVSGEASQPEIIAPALASASASASASDTATTAPAAVQPRQPSSSASSAVGGTFASLMDMFRKGLAALRSVDLSRDQVYQAEDIMFEMRKELVEAERRGRD
ncbi:Rap1-interacting factor 1 N terminal-domain-containing protein [Coniella lustricola]|uniref:Rap1-interacting factor 1 N terminal-domain-containing protein n=1 Tax=Coniella lustricola TaxID=2025994 RepID=A0A2T3A028_9PEZI|nr:Rap1-interacting factor 1 N terminal-domain-containing protein [Coniella lustricola]